MAEDRLNAPRWLLRWELALVVAASAAGLMSIPLMLGHIGLSWDALNHHIYLGWMADHPRFDQDYLAASYQAYQYPYLYWPIYKLALGGASGVMAGVVMAAVDLLVVPAIWLLARACIPGREWFDLAMRALAVALALMSGIVLSMLDTTGNDLLAAIPLVWAFAIALEPLAGGRASGAGAVRAVFLSGFLAGLSVAFKFSNGPIALTLALIWLWAGKGWADRLWLLAIGSLCVLLGLGAAYGWWGWQLWTHFGNPVYPLFDGWFETLRALSGWAHDPF